MTSSELLDAAAAAIRGATAFVFTAGAGMGVDSGLPDFRGTEGFWRAYSPLRALNLRFEDMANPDWFRRDPALAWGFYGHRMMLYRRTVPHAGFAVLRAWAQRAGKGAAVFTSNVDGQHQRAGFNPDLVHEVHGAIGYLQCLDRCGAGIFPADGVCVDVDEATFRARDPLPRCPACGALARPNVLMFGDDGWDRARSDAQGERLDAWLDGLDGRDRVVVVECGAGTAIPSVRTFGEGLVRGRGARLVRINLRDAEVPPGQLGLALGARAALEALQARVAAQA